MTRWRLYFFYRIIYTVRIDQCRYLNMNYNAIQVINLMFLIIIIFRTSSVIQFVKFKFVIDCILKNKKNLLLIRRCTRDLFMVLLSYYAIVALMAYILAVQTC